MKKILFISLFYIAFQLNANAMNLDSYIDFTGNEIAKAADFGSIEPNTYQNLGLGGPVANDYIVEKAFEFTVNQPLNLNSLSVNAQLIPYSSLPSNNPQYNNPQTMDVSFQLYQGTQSWGPSQFPAPGQLAASSNYSFSTPDGQTTGNFNNLNLPLNTQLQPGSSYWIAAQDPQWSSGSTLNYSASFMGTVATPEPSTWLLFGLIFVLVFLRSIYVRKNPA